MPISIDISEDGRAASRCECCGADVLQVMGWIVDDGEAIATYRVKWTPSHPEAEAAFDFIMPDPIDSEMQWAASLAYQLRDQGPALAVVDGSERFGDGSPSLSKVLSTNDLKELDLGRKLKFWANHVLEHDPRVLPLVGDWRRDKHH